MSVYLNSLHSMFAFCKTFSQDMISGGYSSNLEVFNFDAHADLTSLPTNDLVGLAEFGLVVQEKNFSIQTMVGISTLDDENLFRLERLVDQLVYRIQPETFVKYYDVTSGLVVGNLKVMPGLEVFPIVKTDIRPLKFVAVELGADQIMRP